MFKNRSSTPPNGRFDRLPLKYKPVLISVQSFWFGRELQTWHFSFVDNQELQIFLDSTEWQTLQYGYGASIYSTAIGEGGRIIKTISMSNSAD